MSARSIVLAATFLLFASSARATVIEIPLPQLIGNYQNTTHSVAIVLPAPPAVIHSVSFRLSGTKTAGEIYCDEEFPLTQEAVSIVLYAQLSSDDYSSNWFAEEDPAHMSDSGDFSWTSVFKPVPFNSTWSFFMDGSANLTFYGIDPGTWCRFLSSSSAVITEAVFIIDAEFPIAVEPTTWGRVKALYR